MFSLIIALLFVMPSIHLVFTAIFFLLSSFAFGQIDSIVFRSYKKDTSIAQLPKRLTKVSLLSNYYDQDGDRSAINGGLGSQKLESFAQEVSIYLPVNKYSAVKLNGGVDYYTSASLQGIDKYRTSASTGKTGVSGDELRRYASLGYDIGLKKGMLISPSIGFSKEYDVLSYNGGMGILKPVKKWGGSFSSTFHLTVDRWMMILPGEFRSQSLDEISGASTNVISGYAAPIKYKGIGIEKDGQVYPVDWRQSYALTNNYSFAINQKSNASLGLDLLAQTGLLSAPFHRVYFNDGVGDEYQKEVRVETLPRERYKTALSGRYNLFLSRSVILRTQARVYADTWDIYSLTLNVEAAIKIKPSLSVTPFYRYYIQDGTSYYRAYGQHVYSAGSYFTSDMDLASFVSNKFGASVRFAPFKKINAGTGDPNLKASLVKDISLRYARYERQDGLWANMVTLELNLQF